MTDTISVEALLAILVAIATVLSKVLDKFLDFVYKLVMAKTNSGKNNPTADIAVKLTTMGNEIHGLTVWHEYEGKRMLKALSGISEHVGMQTEVLRGLLARMDETKKVVQEVEDHITGRKK